MNVNVEKARLKLSLHGFHIGRIRFLDRFFIYAMVQKLSSVEHAYEFSCFNENNFSTIKDMKNLSKKMNYTGLKDERKHSFLVSLYHLLTNCLTYLYGRIQSPRADVMLDRREGIIKAAGFGFVRVDTQAN